MSHKGPENFIKLAISEVLGTILRPPHKHLTTAGAIIKHSDVGFPLEIQSQQQNKMIYNYYYFLLSFFFFFFFFFLSYLYLKGCASLSIPNGYLSTNNTTHCSTVTVQCRDGYSLVGKSSLTCHEGNWSSVTPSCYEGLLSFTKTCLFQYI